MLVLKRYQLCLLYHFYHYNFQCYCFVPLLLLSHIPMLKQGITRFSLILNYSKQVDWVFCRYKNSNMQ